MEKPAHHILVCGSFRTAGEPQGFCHKKGSNGFVAYLENELADRGLNDVMVSMTTCLKVCDRGPALVVYPENWWFGKIDGEEAIDAILDGLEAGEPADDYLLC